MTKSRHAYLEHQGQLIELPPGEIVLGRGPSCGIRFNDPLVSREHVLLTVNADRIDVKELGSYNGTLVNGESLEGTCELRHDDRLQLGARVLRVALLAEQEGEGLTPTPGWPAVSRVRPVAQPIADAEVAQFNVVTHTCPHCKDGVDINVAECPGCGYRWPRGLAMSVTQPVRTVDVSERRTNRRIAVDLPLIYAGENLTFEATARDLSRGGVFVQSDLLEPVGTLCRVSFLPDAHPAVIVQGAVCHLVATTDGDAANPSGMGVRFDVVSEAGRRWINNSLDGARG